MINKIKFISIIIIIWIAIIFLWHLCQGSIESAISTKQLLDSKLDYIFSQAISNGIIENIINTVFIIVIVWKTLKKEKK